MKLKSKAKYKKLSGKTAHRKLRGKTEHIKPSSFPSCDNLKFQMSNRPAFHSISDLNLNHFVVLCCVSSREPAFSDAKMSCVSYGY